MPYLTIPWRQLQDGQQGGGKSTSTDSRTARIMSWGRQSWVAKKGLEGGLEKVESLGA